MKPKLPKKEKVPPKFFCKLCGGHDESVETHVMGQQHRANKQVIEDAINCAPLREPAPKEERWPTRN